MSEVVEWIVELEIKGAKPEAAESLLNEMASEIGRTEPGTEEWQWFFSSDKRAVTISERYSSSKSALSHLENFSVFADRFLKILSPVRFSVFGNPTINLREAISGFNPEFHQNGGGFRR